MVALEFESARRWARFDPRRALARRDDSVLPFVTEIHIAGPPLLLDTCVYVDQIQGRVPALIEHLIDSRFTSHSTVAMQELMHVVGALDPKDPRTAAAVQSIGRQIKDMSEHRIFVPDIDILGRAALLAGMLSRLQGYAKDNKLKALQDCTLFLQAQKHGFTVLTANIAEFDILLQLIPSGRALFYRAV